MLTAAIIGTGRIAGGYDEDRTDGRVFSHAGAYRAHGGFEIVACVEPDRERRAAFMKRWEIAAGYDDIDAWIADGGSADVVSLCSPDETHEALLLKLAGDQLPRYLGRKSPSPPCQKTPWTLLRRSTMQEPSSLSITCADGTRP